MSHRVVLDVPLKSPLRSLACLCPGPPHSRAGIQMALYLEGL